MAYWIFKIAEQDLYPDVQGEVYVFDNTHSSRVRSGDVFLYLDKSRQYSFTGTGLVGRVTSRMPTPRESSRSERVRQVFTARLKEMISFTKPLSLSQSTKAGRRNRARLGIRDVNLLGWSQSIPSLEQAMYRSIMDLADANGSMPLLGTDVAVGDAEDAWGQTRIRRAMAGFKRAVLERHGLSCAVCGCSAERILDAAHLSPYATDKANRANLANGICLCAFCHRALDQRLIGIRPSGDVLVSASASDAISREHFSRVQGTQRRQWLHGIAPKFLELTVTWFGDSESGQ